VTGIDISPEMTGIARSKKIPGARLLVGDFLGTEFTRRYDVVAAITSVEFMADPARALDTMRGLVKPGGCLFLGLLNRRSVLALSRRIKKKHPFKTAYFFSMREIKKILEHYGKPELESSAFLPPFEKAIPFARIFEAIGTRLFPWAGNFIVCRMIPSTPCEKKTMNHETGVRPAQTKSVQRHWKKGITGILNSGYIRFAGWWSIFAGALALNSTCPLCGSASCPVGIGTTGLIAGLFAALKLWGGRLFSLFRSDRSRAETSSCPKELFHEHDPLDRSCCCHNPGQN
jgi:hypothetical protein